jgi:hypothetical protein
MEMPPQKAKTDRRAYYVQYRKDKVADEEWVKFQRALAYLVKANKPENQWKGKNYIKEPSQKAIEKYGLYMVMGLWFAKVVDDYCRKYENCRQN